MERLSDGGMAMSQINVQRRMRPSISHFVRYEVPSRAQSRGLTCSRRTILYPKLEDNEVVRHYPAVQGMEKNVFFFSHNNRENSEDDSVSKHNMFEVCRIKLHQQTPATITYPFEQVSMIRDLVLYFLKQGPYDAPGDIAVLCAYLGQLQKVRAALKDLKIAVSVDERDEEQLERTGLAGDDDIGFAQVQVARHVSATLDSMVYNSNNV
jgi:hypothetical protein